MKQFSEFLDYFDSNHSAAIGEKRANAFQAKIIEVMSDDKINSITQNKDSLAMYMATIAAVNNSLFEILEIYHNWLHN